MIMRHYVHCPRQLGNINPISPKNNEQNLLFVSLFVSDGLRRQSLVWDSKCTVLYFKNMVRSRFHSVKNTMEQQLMQNEILISITWSREYLDNGADCGLLESAAALGLVDGLHQRYHLLLLIYLLHLRLHLLLLLLFRSSILCLQYTGNLLHTDGHYRSRHCKLWTQLEKLENYKKL